MTQQRKTLRYTKEQQHQVLQLLSNGLAQKEIAHSMSMPQRSVEFILARLRIEFSCSNNERMVKIATQRGIIQ